MSIAVTDAVTRGRCTVESGPAGVTVAGIRTHTQSIAVTVVDCIAVKLCARVSIVTTSAFARIGADTCAPRARWIAQLLYRF